MASNLPWSQIKSRLSAFEKEDLLNLIRDLYQLNSDNKVMLATRLAATSSDGLADDLAEPYKRAIRREFNPDRGLPRLNIGAARKALSSFKKASASLEAVIDMLIYYVEQGVICTNQYGDIHEQFYSSLESAFEEAIKLILKTRSSEIAEAFRPRLYNIVSDTSNVGWGFHDSLSDAFHDAYPND
jgi:hypothetical protein